ncbi:septal ring lytic transglycosylase RlpA family protein [Paraburkholderia ginsengisoli]|nr:septal ring lytic transglycosylase RlpA family protein [Paraburkholderia ginsengisoli]
MKNGLHTAENRRPGVFAKAELVRVKTRWLPFGMTPEFPMYESGGDFDPTRLWPGRKRELRTFLFLILSCCLSAALAAQKAESTDATQARPKAAHHAGLDRSGKTRKGKASYYGRKFYSKKMADGSRMDPQSNAAASKTLPLGTKARVTNLENGNNEVVEIKDRGPYVKDRIVDVSPQTADKLGLKENGTAPVEVKPLAVPQSDGSVKPGAGAAETPRGKPSADSRDRRSSN